MNSAWAPTKHVHLDIELEPDQVFRYWSHGQDGRAIRLSRGDMLTLTCAQPFSIRFPQESPFGARRLDSHRESMLQSREWFITAAVRDDAAIGVYPYTVEATKRGRIFRDGQDDREMLRNGPEIRIEDPDL
jgi:hypothetical protein